MGISILLVLMKEKTTGLFALVVKLVERNNLFFSTHSHRHAEHFRSLVLKYVGVFPTPSNSLILGTPAGCATI